VDSAPDTVLITSNNVAPVANAGPNLGGILSGTIVTLNGSASSDPNGNPLTYSWTFQSKPAGSAVSETGEFPPTSAGADVGRPSSVGGRPWQPANSRPVSSSPIQSF